MFNVHYWFGLAPPQSPGRSSLCLFINRNPDSERERGLSSITEPGCGGEVWGHPRCPSLLPLHSLPPQKGGGALLHSVKAKTQPAVRNMYRSVRLLNTGHLPGGRRQGDRGHFHASLRPHTLIPHFYQNQTGSFTTNTSSQFYSPFTVIIFVRILAFFFSI